MEKKNYIEEINLPSGAVLGVKTKFKGKDIREAQKMSGTDSSKIMFALIALTCDIDGKPFVMEDIDEMEGADVFQMLAIFGDPK
jgi:hypothetical protein